MYELLEAAYVCVQGMNRSTVVLNMGRSGSGERRKKSAGTVSVSP